MLKDSKRIDWDEVRAFLALLFLIVVAAVGVLLLIFWISEKTEAASPIGPWIGLRGLIYDTSRKGLPNPYWLMKLKQDQVEILPDPAGASDGILSFKFPAPGPTYAFGRGFLTVTQLGQPTQVSLDTAYMVSRYVTEDFLPPTLGSDCPSSASIWTGDAGFYYCKPNAQRTGFVWATIAAALPPVIGSACGPGGTWQEKNGLFVCSKTDPEHAMWALVPMQTP
jgi:hypothetical protein